MGDSAVFSVGSRLLLASPGGMRKGSDIASPFFTLDSAKVGRRPRNDANAKVQGSASTVLRTIAFGLVNALVMLPTNVAFASIIYKDSFFSDIQHNFLPQAIKLTFLSSAIHQICFLVFSSLPFAVGQVQDAGLIFMVR